MKYMLTWNERPMGSAAAYEEAQRRILDVFKHWQFAADTKVLQFVIRVGDWGGYMLLETTNPAALHKLTTLLPAFTFKVELVVDINEAIATELEIMDWRDSLKA